jgi:CheY-like chemotaxis protein
LRIAFQKAGLGHALSHVRNGEEAIQYLTGKTPFADRAAHPFPQLLLLDIMMPGTTGFDVLTFLRDQPALKMPVILMLSGSVVPEDAKKAIDLGATAYFSKPTEFSELIGLVKTIHHHWLDC